MMNELDNFKNVWNTISEAKSHKDFSADDLKKIVKKSSNSELAKIRRKIIVEWGLTFVLSASLVFFIHQINPSDTVIALLFIFVILSLGFFPYISIIRLKFSNHYDLKNYLHEFILRFEKLVKQYSRMAAVLIPVVGLGGFLLGFHSAATIDEWNSFFKANNVILVSFIILFVSFVGYWVQTQYFNWIYGKNIQRLRDCLADLEDVDEMDL